jgi:hypothetical protein
MVFGDKGPDFYYNATGLYISEVPRNILNLDLLIL